MSYWDWDRYPPKTTARERAEKAEKQRAALAKKGEKLSPVILDGRTIARTFWGKAWCTNLESYGDYANRIPRGRSYVRSGSVLDLRIEPGQVSALVQGTRLYRITITIGPVAPARWKTIVSACSGKIDSVVELLQGKLSAAVMTVITDKATGLFPAPREIKMACSCPDSASMCKHLAATLYGIGARLDEQPELLFRLRGADPLELVASAAKGAVLGAGPMAPGKALAGDLGSVFGIALDRGPGAEEPEVPPSAPKKSKRAKGAAAPKPETMTNAELRARGVPDSTRLSWAKSGVLVRTAEAGVYELTAAVRERLKKYERR